MTRDTDEEGRVILVCFYDAEGNLVVTPAGYAVVARAYDEEGRQIQEAYFGADEEPIDAGNGYAGWSAEYDADGNAVKTYVAADGTVVEK